VTNLTDIFGKSSGAGVGSQLPVIAEVRGGLILILGVVLGLLISGRGAPGI